MKNKIIKLTIFLYSTFLFNNSLPIKSPNEDKLIISTNDKYIISAVGNSVKLWNIENIEKGGYISWLISSNNVRLAFSLDHGSPISSVSITPNGKYIITAGGTEIKIWNLEKGKLLATLSHKK